MWRVPTVDDLASTLSQREIDAFRASCGLDGRDPAEDLVRRTAEMVRGYIRPNTSVRMDPRAASIPEALVSPAMDYAAYDILKRLPVAVNEDRRAAREQALAVFEKVSRNDITPESYAPDGADDGGSELAATPLAGAPEPVRLLD